MKKETNETMKTTATKTATKATPKKTVPAEVPNVSTTDKKILDTCTKSINKEMASVEKSFLKIGYELYMLSTKFNAKSFTSLGYKNIYDYAQKEFNIARGTCSDFMHIIEHFAKRDESGHILCELDEKYKDFSSSKLSIMITLSDEELANAKSDMTVKAIKALKKKGKDDSKSDNADTSDSKEDSDVIDDDDYEISNVVIKFRTLEEYNAIIDKLDDLIVRCLKAGHSVTVSETVQKVVRTSEQ